MKAARDQFYVPAELKVVVIYPELYERDLLRLDESYKTDKGGIMSPCPSCKTNKGMKIIGWSSSRKNCQRVLNTKLFHDIVIGARYACTYTNPMSNQKCNKTFTSYYGDLWQQFPKPVKRRYLDYVSPLSFNDRTTHQMMSPGFCDKLLFHKGSFEEFSRSLANSVSVQAREALTMYRNFIEEEADLFPSEKPNSMTASAYANKKTQKWPKFDDASLSSFFKMPAPNTVIKMWEAVYAKAEPNLLRDLLSRTGGRFVRVDGTYLIMKKTMNLSDAEAANNVLVKVLGEYGHVLIYAFTETENHEVKERLLYFLKQRYLRIGGQAAVDEVIAGYDDLCCNNSDPSLHFLPKLFPNCQRAFLKDVWHAIDIVKRETAGADHPLHEAFFGGLWGAILKWEEQSAWQTLQHFRSAHPEGKKYSSEEAAREAMFKLKRYKDAIFNFIPQDTSKMSDDVWKLYEATKKLDEENRAKALLCQEGYRPFFKKAIRNHQCGGEQAIINLLEHIQKGCLSDPLQPRDMSYRASDKPHTDGGPPLLRRLRGTNIVESTISSVITESLTSLELLLDLEIGLSGKHCKDLTNLTATMFDDSIQYPPPLDMEAHMEPIGENYQLYTEWQKIDAMIASLVGISSSNTAPLDPIEDDLFGGISDEAIFETIEEVERSQTVEEQLASPSIQPHQHMNLNATAGAFATDGVQNEHMISIEASPLQMAAQQSTPSPQQQPTAAAESFSELQTNFSERIAERTPPRSPKKASQESSGFGATRYGTRKAMFKAITIHNSYIAEPLSARQRALVLRAYEQVMGSTPDFDNLPLPKVHERVATVFNSWHLEAVGARTPAEGFGGKIRVESVKTCLEQAAQPIVRQQIQVQAVGIASGRTAPIPTLNQINNMSQRDLKRHLQRAGEIVRGTKEQQRKRLKERYNL
ncbi:hypothetical protein SEMRO_3274_G346120.1 [Seminavis robusta]|uniref:Uncharacterized protein n=1 Tax=Seminavis robusta TaxID=568900 RepID=A0A9N8F1H7_9STRA|nr:hypothetical protein SEMRO_3274_G346120.1 [Seminavis robusta]|eukprot:Sro3274_g346120.1 n/a (921) ;mRNA; r:4382-7238